MLNLCSRHRLSPRKADVLIRRTLIEIPCSFIQGLDAAAGRMGKAAAGGGGESSWSGARCMQERFCPFSPG